MGIKLMKNKGISNEQRIKKKKQHNTLNVRVLVYSFIVTLILYAFMLFIERTILKSEEHTTVYVAQTDINENTMLTAENIPVYFAAMQRRSDWLPADSVTDMTQLLNMLTSRKIAQNEVITSDILLSRDTRTDGIVLPVEVSINANNLSQVVGGILREGDRINIWSVTELNDCGISTVKAEKICDYAYVTRVFTAAGVQVKKGLQEESAAMVVNIIIPGEKEEDFNIAMGNGTLRIGRCMYEKEETSHGEKEN